jgi:hypothetical protein
MIDNELLDKLYSTNSKIKVEALQESPQPRIPVINVSDVKSGFINRYFIRPVNDMSYVLEIDGFQFNKFQKNPRFVTCKIQWKIVGQRGTFNRASGAIISGVEDLNRATVLNADLTFGGLSSYISDYLQYWISEE